MSPFAKGHKPIKKGDRIGGIPIKAKGKKAKDEDEVIDEEEEVEEEEVEEEGAGEEETVITVVRGEDNATVLTSNRRMKNKMDKLVEAGLAVLEQESRTENLYTLPASFIMFRKPREYTDEQREEARARFADATGRPAKKAAAKKAVKGKKAPKLPKVEEEDVEDEGDEEEVEQKPAKKAKAKKA